MRVVSTNTGKTRSYELQGVTVRSSMRRSPTLDGLRIYFDHVENDVFSLPKIHGIKEAVVYAFSASTFNDFERMYEQDVTAGNVGENLTMDALDESLMIVGDEYEVGGGLTALKEAASGKRTRQSVRPLCEQVVKNYLIPEFLRSRFQKFI